MTIRIARGWIVLDAHVDPRRERAPPGIDLVLGIHSGIGVVALLTGLCLGLAAARWALIISTSLVGTSFVATGLATLLTHSVPDSYQAFQNNPSVVGIGLGGFLVTSLVLQTLLSRKSTSDKSESKASL